MRKIKVIVIPINYDEKDQVASSHPNETKQLPMKMIGKNIYEISVPTGIELGLDLRKIEELGWIMKILFKDGGKNHLRTLAIDFLPSIVKLEKSDYKISFSKRGHKEVHFKIKRTRKEG